MFVTKDTRYGVTNLVFTVEDPQKDGREGEVVEGVTLDYDMEAVHLWPDGHPRPEACVGRAPDNPKHYKVFKYGKEREAAGYEPVAGTPVVFGSWSDYLRLRQDAEQFADEHWYEFLDDVDEISRRRRQRAQVPSLPPASSRDVVAEWVAKKHLVADSAIREVWYLPRGAPSDEIRLLELNDRLAGNGSKPEALDFGLDIDGARFRLLVADITSEQLEQIKRDPSRLPPGWSLVEKAVWRRGHDRIPAVVPRSGAQ